MKVILRKDITNLGNVGEIITVKDGYARNFLIPRGYAYFASPGAVKAIEQEKKLHQKRVNKEKSEAEVIAAQLSEKQITVSMKVGEEGKLYGSVTSAMISEELALLGYSIDKRNILIEEPIKSLGIFDVKVKVHQDVFATVKVWVISEE